jgi:hypothetical protein
MRGLSLTGALVSVLVASEIGLLRSAAAFKLTSRAFDDGEPIPSEYLKDDDNISPPLEFEDAPAGELRRGRSARERIRMHAAPSPRAPTRSSFEAAAAAARCRCGCCCGERTETQAAANAIRSCCCVGRLVSCVP